MRKVSAYGAGAGAGGAARGRGYLVAEDDSGRILGGCGFAEVASTPGTAELQKLYVSQACRGTGIGRELATDVIDAARRAGYERLYLETHHVLGAAMSLYSSLGFERIDGPLPGSAHTTMDLFYLLGL